MELADGVRAVRQPQRERGHVELAAVAVDAEAELEHPSTGTPPAVEQRPGDAADEVGVEALVAGRDRRVDGEHAVAPDRLPGRRRGSSRRRRISRARSARSSAEWPFVEVPDRRVQPQGPERPHAADAQDDLLVQPHLATADVQDVGDRPVGIRVLGAVRVEQQDRHPADLGEPDGHGQVAPGQLHGDRQRQAGRVLDAAQRQPAEVVVGVVVLLVAVGIDRLAEVALAVQQPDADDGSAMSLAVFMWSPASTPRPPE